VRVFLVTPAKAGVQNAMNRLDSGLRRNNAEGLAIGSNE